MKTLQNRITLSFIVLLAYPAFAQEPYTPNIQSISDSEQDYRIVATVGNIEISAKEFLVNYEYGPVFLKRQKDSKRRYLDVMINEKALALEGFAQKLHKTNHVKNILAQIKSDLMTEELFKEDVMGNVVVTEKEIQKAVEQDLKHIHIKWLFRKTLGEMENDFMELKRGMSFDVMFSAQLNDSVLIDDRSMETTLFDLNNKNPVLMSIIDTLKVGSLTHPVKTQDGYYIIKVEKGWSDILLTETEWNSNNAKMRKTLFKQKMDSLSDQYVENLMSENNPLIRRPAFNLIRAWLARITLSKKVFSEWDFLENSEMKEAQYLDKKILNRGSSELVGLHVGSISLREFISWYNPRRTYIKLSQLSKDDFSVSAQNIIFRMVRDKLLTDRALQRGLHKHEKVLRQIRWWEEKTVYAKYKLELANSVQITEEGVFDYYNNNINSFRSKNGNYQSFAKVKTEIRNILLRERYSAKLIRNVLTAKQKYKIEIDDEVLDDLFVDIQNDPKAIEIYTVKKGGLFPRQPYPTIDSEWKYWF